MVMKKIVLYVLSLLPAAAFAQAQIAWTQPTRGVSIAVDAQHNVFTVDYDYSPAGDISLVKRNPSGDQIWSVGYNQTDNTKWEKAAWVATDSQGNAIVCGTLMSGYSNPVNAASLLMKFSPAGDLLWRLVFESDFDGSYTQKCLVDEQNSIYVLGMGPGPGNFATNVKKFSAAGDSLWSFFDQAGIGAPVNLKFTPDQGILLIGRGIVGSVDGFAKIDRNGNLLWSLPGQMSETVGDAAGDAAGNTYVVHKEYVFNGRTILKKLNSGGAQIWSRTFPFAGNRVEVGSDGQPIVSGYPSAGSFGAAFIKTDSSGALVWSTLDADGPLSLMLHAQLLMDHSNNAYLAAGTLQAMAVCKISADGTPAWTLTTPGSYANAIALGSDNSVYVVGGQTARIVQEIASPVVVYGFEANCLSRLRWNAVAGAVGYNIYQTASLGEPWTLAGTTTQTTWPAGCEDADVRFFRVTAVTP
jgi:hypothetical protein